MKKIFKKLPPKNIKNEKRKRGYAKAKSNHKAIRKDKLKLNLKELSKIHQKYSSFFLANKPHKTSCTILQIILFQCHPGLTLPHPNKPKKLT
jgi:hypothetical protein